MNKVEKSQILKVKAGKWYPVKENKFPIKERVVIRLKHMTRNTGEDDWYVYPLEDTMVASSDSNGKWRISPPFPLFDYSPLSTKEKIHKDVIVTHWRYPEEGELDGWDTRFDRIREYDHLNLEVDEKNLEDVYKALLHASYYMNNYGGLDVLKEGTEIRKYYEIICDLQNSLDRKQKKED